jgi:hypothetical protein
MDAFNPWSFPNLLPVLAALAFVLALAFADVALVVAAFKRGKVYGACALAGSLCAWAGIVCLVLMNNL